MVQYLRQSIDVENAVVVSPDAGGAKRYVHRPEICPECVLLAYVDADAAAEHPPLRASSIWTSHCFTRSGRRQTRYLEWSWLETLLERLPF